MNEAKSEYAKALEQLLRCWRCGGDGNDHGQRCHVCNGRGGPNVSELDGDTINEAIEKIREETAAWQEYERLPQTTEMRPWTPDVDMERVSISQEDKEGGHPKEGGMIARDKENHDDQWYIREEYFQRHFNADPLPNTK
jgi:hypothetical protein